MEFKAPSYVVALVVWLSLMGGIFRIFDYAEQVASLDARRRLANWLQREPDNSKARLPALFIEAFDAVFGANFWSWKRLRRSLLVTSTVLVVFGLIGLLLDSVANSMAPKAFLVVGVTAFTVSILTNLIPDMLSLALLRGAMAYAKKTVPMALPALVVFEAGASLLLLEAFFSLSALFIQLFVPDLPELPAIYEYNSVFVKSAFHTLLVAERSITANSEFFEAKWLSTHPARLDGLVTNHLGLVLALLFK